MVVPKPKKQTKKIHSAISPGAGFEPLGPGGGWGSLLQHPLLQKIISHYRGGQLGVYIILDLRYIYTIRNKAELIPK